MSRLLGLALAVLFVGAVLPSVASAAEMQRVAVALQNNDRESEIEELFDALRGYRYRVVSIGENSPTVILDVSQKALDRLRALDFVIAVATHDAGGSPPPAAKLQSFQVILRRNADFDSAVEQIRGALRKVSARMVQADRRNRIVIVAMREKDMGLVGTLSTVESVVLAGAVQPGDGVTPLPKGEGTIEDNVSPIPEGEDTVSRGAPDLQRVIVQFSSGNRDAEIRRILRALNGLPHKVAKRFAYSPSIVIDMDERGIRALKRLGGLSLSLDTPVPPT